MGKILVIDDDQHIRAALPRALVGHEVHVAENGAAALPSLLGDEQFDAILCDLMMPLLNGMQLYQAVRQHAPHRASRFIFMTGGVHGEPLESFADSLGPRLIQKPVGRSGGAD